MEKEKQVGQALVARPVEPTADNAVVRWFKWGNSTQAADQGYVYASVKGGSDADNPQGALWYTTQDPRRSGGNKILPATWDDLLDQIGERNWPSLELLD